MMATALARVMKKRRAPSPGSWRESFFLLRVEERSEDEWTSALGLKST